MNLNKLWREICTAVNGMCAASTANESAEDGLVVRAAKQRLEDVRENDGPRTNVRASELESAVAQVYKMVAKTTVEYASARKENAKTNIRRANSDAANGYSKLFRQLKANQAPPVSLLKVDGRLTGDMGKIHEEFAAKWEVFFNRL